VNLSGLTASSDLVGRRIRLDWDVELASGESFAAIPEVVVRRKTKDFEFPAPPSGSPDPFVLYDSSSFPPAGDAARDLDLGSGREDGFRYTSSAISVARSIAGQLVEVQRLTLQRYVDDMNNPLRQHVQLLDHDLGETGLLPGTTYYYQLTTTLPGGGSPLVLTAVATAREFLGLGQTMYQSIPSVYRNPDVVTAQPLPGSDFVPEAMVRTTGQLSRFVDIFGLALDNLTGMAKGLSDLHDVDDVDYRFLPLLAQWLAWDLSVDQAIPLQRHEIKYAADLYRITGTVPGCMLWVQRLTGWSAEIKEFGNNVFVTNNVGNPADTTRTGSYTVNAADATLLANRGTFNDSLSYTCDSGTDDGDWFNFHTIGIFATPASGETMVQFQQNRLRLLSSTTLFVPVNLRVVLIVVVPPTTDVERTALGVMQSTESEPV
jgi:phage tail-like protein